MTARTFWAASGMVQTHGRTVSLEDAAALMNLYAEEVALCAEDGDDAAMIRASELLMELYLASRDAFFAKLRAASFGNTDDGSAMK